MTRISVPQMVHLKLSLTRLSSPGGGGSGIGRENAAIIHNPMRYTTKMNSSDSGTASHKLTNVSLPSHGCVSGPRPDGSLA